MQTVEEKIERYMDFLHSKIRVAEKHGIVIDAARLHPSSKPHQVAIIPWALELGAGLVAPDCGTGKSHMAIETCRILTEDFGGKALIVTELGAAETFINPDPEVGEGARLGVTLEYVTSQAEAMASECSIIVTNYERVRMGCFDFGGFTVVWLDEGNYIKNMASETTEALGKELKKVKYKYIASATPSPNETLELVNYAHVLGIADRGQILTQFFQRNSVKAGELTLHPQHEADFWLWVHSWMVAIELPSDLGFSDEGYSLPELNVEWHEITLGKAWDAGVTKDGQKKMFLDTGNSLPDNAKIKRESIEVRLQAVDDLVNKNSDVENWLIWHNLEDERKGLNKLFKDHASYGDLFGSQPHNVREKRIVDFTKGILKILATKPSLSGVGCNFQKHCSNAIWMGVDNDFNLFYQMIKRIHRFGQAKKVNFHVFYLPEEYSIVQNLKRKWELHIKQRAWLTDIVKKFGLNHKKMIDERRRTFKVARQEFKGANYTLVNTDAVLEWFNVPDNSIDLGNSSFPFGNHYEYTNFYNDFGHNTNNNQFKKQLDFLLPELFRTIKPGRIFAVHLKNRIHYGSVTGLGFSIFHRFTHMVCDAMEEHGFYTMGFHYIPTCVVGENNQTYRLTYGEMQKDSSKMGAGIPEEIWIFRKPPTSTANAYADSPVVHNHATCSFCGHHDLPKVFSVEGSFLYKCDSCKQFLAEGELIMPAPEEKYSLSQWQIDADAFWLSSGNRYITPFEMKTWGLDKIRAWWDKFNPSVVYDYDKHIELLEELDKNRKLSRTFTTLPLISNTPYIWNNVNRMHGLNMEQSRRKERNHICPQPFDEVDRVIDLYSNPGDLVADSFGGLGTTGVRSLKKKRRAFMTELNDIYAKASDYYMNKEEQKVKIPTLFDVAQFEVKKTA